MEVVMRDTRFVADAQGQTGRTWSLIRLVRWWRCGVFVLVMGASHDALSQSAVNLQARSDIYSARAGNAIITTLERTSIEAISMTTYENRARKLSRHFPARPPTSKVASCRR